jgi:exonuclease VII large subunit
MNLKIIMNKYKVTLLLMIDPSNGDETLKKSYTVEADDERNAVKKAEKMQENDDLSIKYLSVFDYEVKIIK